MVQKSWRSPVEVGSFESHYFLRVWDTSFRWFEIAGFLNQPSTGVHLAVSAETPKKRNGKTRLLPTAPVVSAASWVHFRVPRAASFRRGVFFLRGETEIIEGVTDSQLHQ